MTYGRLIVPQPKIVLPPHDLFSLIASFLTLPLSHTDPLPRVLLHFTIQQLLKTQKPENIKSFKSTLNCSRVHEHIQYKHRLTVYLTYPRDLPLVILCFRQDISKPYRLREGYLSPFFLKTSCTNFPSQYAMLSQFIASKGVSTLCIATSTSSVACPFCAR